MSTEEFLLSLGFDNPILKAWMRFQASRLGCKLDCGPYVWNLCKDSRILRFGRRHYSMVAQMAAEFDGIFETLVARQTGHQSLIDFSHIQLHTHRSSGLKFELAHWPESDKVIAAYLSKSQPVAADLTFDLGAACGVSTFALSNISKSLVAFEADLQFRTILERNVQRLGMTNTVVAKEEASSLSQLINIHGVPAICKANLYLLPPDFLFTNAAAWTKLNIRVAAHGSQTACDRLRELLESCDFETASDDTLGMLWAHRNPDAPA